MKSVDEFGAEEYIRRRKDRSTTVTMTQQNGLNTTGNEPVDSTCYIYKVNEQGVDAHLHHSSFVGLRDDKNPRSVVREDH